MIQILVDPSSQLIVVSSTSTLDKTRTVVSQLSHLPPHFTDPSLPPSHKRTIFRENREKNFVLKLERATPPEIQRHTRNSLRRLSSTSHTTMKDKTRTTPPTTTKHQTPPTTRYPTMLHNPRTRSRPYAPETSFSYAPGLLAPDVVVAAAIVPPLAPEDPPAPAPAEDSPHLSPL